MIPIEAISHASLDVRKIRKTSRLTQEEFCKVLGISRRRLQYIEAYDQKRGRLTRAERLALAEIQSGRSLK